MTTEYDFAFSRRIASEFVFETLPSQIRGCREDRVRAAPAVSCAVCAQKRAHEHTGSAGASRPSLRNGFTAYFVLSPVNGSFATVIMRILPHHLTPAPRRQDHTTSPYAWAAHVSRSSRVHRISPHVRDDGQRPSFAVRRADSITDLPDGASGIFLREGMDRLLRDLPVGLKCRSVSTCPETTLSVIPLCRTSKPTRRFALKQALPSHTASAPRTSCCALVSPRQARGRVRRPCR